MAGIPLATAPVQENLNVEEREQGQCRICLEFGGADLMAPCLCKGSGKWVHRHCLDHWRSRGQGSRTFTHCPQCHFAYLMELVRAPTETEQNLRERRRRVLRQAAGHFVLGVLVLQLVLCTVAVLIRLCDPTEQLVELMPFFTPILPGEDKRSFLQAFRFHKTTYYFASIVFCLAMTGFMVTVFYIAKACSGLCPRRQSEGCCGNTHFSCNVYCCDVCCDFRYPYYSSRSIYTPGPPQPCCSGCDTCCDACCSQDCCSNCPNAPSAPSNFGGSSSSSNNNNNNAVAVIFVVILVFFVLIGLFFAMAALVAWIQKTAQRYLALKELQVLTGEYIVKDLSELEKQFKNDPEQGQNIEVEPSAPPMTPVWVPMMPQEVQSNLYRDLQAVYGYQAS